MKIVSKYIFVALLIYAKSTAAFVVPPGPLSPVFDGVNDAIESGKAIMKEYRTVADQAQQIKDEALNDLKSAKNFVSLDMVQSPLKKADDEPVIATAKDIVEADVADIKDAESVSNAYQKLFLEYPTDLIEQFASKQKELVMHMYQTKREAFANDSMMELYLSIRDLEENRLPMLASEIETLSKCYVEGEEGASSLCESASAADEELGNAANDYKLQAAFDSYVRLYQELIALKAQYEAAFALQRGVRPFNAEEVETSEPTEDEVSYYHYEAVETSAFAQEAKSGLLQQDDAAAKPQVSKQKKSNKVVNPALQLEKSLPFKKHTPFQGAEEEMKLLPVMEGIYDLLSEAQQMHNTKQQLPDLRKPFLEYEKMRALHDVAVSKVVESEDKVRNYFTNYYDLKSANDLWFGKGCALRLVKLGKKCPIVTGCVDAKDYVDYFGYYILCPDDIYSVTEYAKKRGLSGYAISAYRLSKADKILDTDGDVIGYVNEAGSALDLSGKKIGLLDKDKKMVLDDDGNSLGSVVSTVLQMDESELGTAVVDLDMQLSTPDIDEEPDLDAMVDGQDLSAPSDEAEAEASLREQGLNRWQIGSEISKLVGKDMQGTKSFGVAQKKYPVWNDEKRFYAQYLDEKFKNMRLYLTSPRVNLGVFELASYINNEMKIDQAALDAYNKAIDAQYAEPLAYWQNLYQEAKLTTDKNYALNQMTNIKAERGARKARYRAELEGMLYIEKQANAGIIQAAKTTWEKTVENYENSSELSKMLTSHHQAIKDLSDKFSKDLQNLEKEKKILYSQIDEKSYLLNDKKQKYNDLMSLKKDAKESMEAEDESVKMIEEREKKDPSYISGLKGKALERKIESQEAMQNAELEAEGVLEGVDELSDEVGILRKQVENVDRKIENLKKEYIKNAVALEHKQFQQMKTALENRGLDMPQIPSELLIGATKTIAPIYTISVEMVENFKKNALEAVDAAYESLVMLGDDLYNPDKYAKIANIHKEMLQKMAGSGYDLANLSVADLFLTNAPIIDSAASVMFSIMFGDRAQYEKEDEVYMVSMNPNPRDFYAAKRISPERTAPIREVFHFDATDYDTILKTDGENPQTTRQEFLKITQEVPTIWKTILGYNGFVERDVDVESILDVSNKANVEAFLKAKGEKAVSVGSELAVFLKYNKGLTFTKPMYETVKYFEDVAQSDEEIDEDEIKEREKRMLARDQVGDYLQFVDLEQTYQTLLSQLQVKINESRQNIESVLEKVSCPYTKKVTGYIKEGEIQSKIVSTEYIADEETYEAVSKCLDEGKNMFIKEALGLMNKLPSELGEYVSERKAKTDNMLRALEMDSNEVVQLSDNTQADAELAQEIKAKTADRAVVDRYGEEAQAEFEKNLEQFEKPYLAVYF